MLFQFQVKKHYGVLVCVVINSPNNYHLYKLYINVFQSILYLTDTFEISLHSVWIFFSFFFFLHSYAQWLSFPIDSL